MSKNSRIQAIIQRLEEREALKYRSCTICKHIGETLRAYGIPNDYNGLILSPCLGCDKTHDCFQLDMDALMNEVDTGLLTKKQARTIVKKENERNNYYET